MSALGVIPGYGYPQLDYASAEFAEFTQPTFTLAVAGTPIIPIAKSGQGFALYIRDISCVLVTSAAAGTRTLNVQFEDGDGNVFSSWRNPLTPAPSTQNQMSWNIGVSSGYTILNFGYSPLLGIVLPTGFSIVFALTGGQIGDNLQFIAATGLRIGTGLPPAGAIQAVKPLVMT